HQGEVNIFPSAFVHNMVGGANHPVNTSLGTHNADIHSKKCGAALQSGLCGTTLKALEIGAVAHHHNLVRWTAAPSDGQAVKRLIRDDHQVGQAVGTALQQQ